MSELRIMDEELEAPEVEREVLETESIKPVLCYVFDEAIGQTEEMLLISLSAIIDAKINILYHMKESNKNACKDLRFWPNDKTFEEICNDVSMEKKIQSVIQHHEKMQPRDMYLSTKEYDEVEIEHLITLVEEVYMTEIQLRRIVDRNALEGSEQQSDGDERMMKDGENISKFSKEAMTLGDDVYAHARRQSTHHIKKGVRAL